MGDGIFQMIATAGRMEQAILVMLALGSIALWAIVFLKFPELRASKRNSMKFLDEFHDSESFANMKQLDKPDRDCVHLRIFKAAMAALEGKKVPKPPTTSLKSPEAFRIHPTNTTEELLLLNMQHTSGAYFLHLQRGVSFLATLGSTTPFIGLFGTVVGIMTTFHDLGTTKTPSMQVVAPGISGALVATAAGLAVAIPAVIVCNMINSEVEELREAANAFIERMMAVIRANEQGAKVANSAAALIRAVTPPPLPAVAKPATPVARKSAADEDLDDDEDDDDEENELATPAQKSIQKPAPKMGGPSA